MCLILDRRPEHPRSRKTLDFLLPCDVGGVGCHLEIWTATPLREEPRFRGDSTLLHRSSGRPNHQEIATRQETVKYIVPFEWRSVRRPGAGHPATAVPSNPQGGRIHQVTTWWMTRFIELPTLHCWPHSLGFARFARLRLGSILDPFPSSKDGHDHWFPHRFVV